jgi:hypothetical protein
MHIVILYVENKTRCWCEIDLVVNFHYHHLKLNYHATRFSSYWIAIYPLHPWLKSPIHLNGNDCNWWRKMERVILTHLRPAIFKQIDSCHRPLSSKRCMRWQTLAPIIIRSLMRFAFSETWPQTRPIPVEAERDGVPTVQHSPFVHPR